MSTREVFSGSWSIYGTSVCEKCWGKESQWLTERVLERYVDKLAADQPAQSNGVTFFTVAEEAKFSKHLL